MINRSRLARLLSLSLAMLAFVFLAAAVPKPAAAEARVQRSGSFVTLTNDLLTVRYDLARGLADYAWGGRTLIRNGYASATLADEPGSMVYTFQAADRSAAERDIHTALGSGVALEVTSQIAGVDVTLIQEIVVYDEQPFLTVRTSLARTAAGGDLVSTDQIEVLAASAASDPSGGASIGPVEDARFYAAPFYNNDDFTATPIAHAAPALSYWLGGIVDAGGGPGLIMGAIETNRWKSAVFYHGPTDAFSAHSGTRSPVDTVASPPQRGRRVDSALTFVGYRDRYQVALADLMFALGQVEPPLAAPPLPAPVGWSAWYHHGVLTDERIVRGVTDFIADNWAALGYRYINLDAGWNRADGDTRWDPVKFPSGIEALVRHIHDRGLLAGGYFVPFAINPGLIDQQAPGTEYRFGDMLVRDADGRPIRASILDWEYVLDTTHPGALPYLAASAGRLVTYGFDFVKLDFLQIGTQEGVRYDREATAMDAFHRGMAAITRVWLNAEQPMFISAAISPLYVHQYAHARRVGNDVEFGQAREASNVGLSWFTGLLYHRNDPDNAVLRQNWFPGYNDRLARLHATMAALGGTLFLAGDDPRDLTAGRAELLTNPDVLALAREPLVIRPLTIERSPAPVWHAASADGSHIVAIFNWDGAATASHTIRFGDLGLAGSSVYSLSDLWEATDLGTRESSFSVELPPHGVALIRITRRE